MSVRVYVEGGGDTSLLKRRCREGFSEFFRKAGLEGRMPRVVASGARMSAYSDFCTAVKNVKAGDFVVLLVDSEEAIESDTKPWFHLKNRKGDGWEQPESARDESIHLMVQCMEAWFMADRECLVEYFGDKFNQHALPKREDVEKIDKDDLFRFLNKATHRCEKTGKYSKGRHSFEILARLDPDKVVNASPYAKRLIDTLVQKLV